MISSISKTLNKKKYYVSENYRGRSKLFDGYVYLTEEEYEQYKYSEKFVLIPENTAIEMINRIREIRKGVNRTD